MNQRPPEKHVLIKHAKDPATAGDGKRILIDRNWPRGLSHETGTIDEWISELAPSTKLERWLSYDAARWPEFCEKYARELHIERLDELRAYAVQGPITLVYNSKNAKHNTAVALRDLILRVHSAISGDAVALTEKRRSKYNGKDHRKENSIDIARWDSEGGAGPDGPQDSVARSHVSADVLKPTNLELAQLRVRVIALENLVITLLAEASDRQLHLAREMAAFIAPQSGQTPHPLAAHAAAQMIALIDRAQHFRVRMPH